MKTPIADFVRRYAENAPHRLHMPGHKGVPSLGCEPYDITEVAGADVLLSADGIIKESQENASALFGSRDTLYATGGSSQCVRAMVYLAMTCRKKEADPVILAARNVHQSFVYAAAAMDVTPVWLLGSQGRTSLCTCPVTPQELEAVLKKRSAPVAGVYVTSPDYLGVQQPIAELSQVCHRYGTVLLVDNAHGGYLRFLPQSKHPMDLGADMCCDSAHKTLSVLTGGAYLHIGKNAPTSFSKRLSEAMAMFATTSPSYLILASLDLCNAYLADGYAKDLKGTVSALGQCKKALGERGWTVLPSDPLRLTLHTADVGVSGTDISEKLHGLGVECEFADEDFLVAMVTPQNTPKDLEAFMAALDTPPSKNPRSVSLKEPPIEQVLSVREALFAPHKTISSSEAEGKICGAPVVGCPPAVPIAVCGERFSTESVRWLNYYKIPRVIVVEE